jgi:5-methylcytosine-specific restriction endonuclease McrA
MKFQLESHSRNTPDAELLDELRRVATQLEKQTVTIDEFNDHAAFHSTTLSRRFGTWMAALEAAGLKRSRNLNITNEALFENLAAVWLKLGRQPKYQDLTKEHSLFSSGTYEKRFGTWRKGLEAFVEWANSDEPKPQIDEVPSAMPTKRGPRNINWRLRALVLMRDGGRCQLCGAEAKDGAKLHIDHVVPWANGGETKLANLQALCEVCNIGKSNVEPSALSS